MIDTPDFGYCVERADLRSILSLRHSVLREGMPIEEAHFDGDHERDTWHMGIFYLDRYGERIGTVVCCATFMLNGWEGKPAWQLRGMATYPQFRGTGFGRKLLQESEQVISQSSRIKLFWCNAREPAVQFYEKQDWKIVSDIFEIPTAGFHRKMIKQLL